VIKRKRKGTAPTMLQALADERSKPRYLRLWRRVRDAAFVLTGYASAIRLED
jgi:hypothetical protein